MAPILEARGISKRFQATQALDKVDFSVEPAEVHALMGENGAGKSTLAKIFAGVTIPDEGETYFDGERVTISDPKRARDIGIGIVFQELDLFPHLSVADNIAIGNSKAKEQFFIRRSELNEWCAQFLRQVQLDIDPDTKLATLSISQVQLVAIARALSLGAKVIFFDEPTSSLARDDASRLLALIKELRVRGVSSVYVTHKMEEVQQIADRVTVMRDGKYVGTRAARDLSTEELVHMMVGRHIEVIERRANSNSREDMVLEVRNLETEFLRGITFSVKAGEVLGIAGLVGSGRSELGAALLGMRKFRAGSVSLRGKAFAPADPREAIDQGFGLSAGRQKIGRPLSTTVYSGKYNNLGASPVSHNGSRSHRNSSGRGVHGEIWHAISYRSTHRYTQRRQSAKNDVGALVHGRSGCALPRRADSRNRCRRQTGNLQIDRRDGCPRKSDCTCQFRIA